MADVLIAERGLPSANTPALADSDMDGISDRVEINLKSFGLDPAVPNPELADRVNSSLTDGLRLEDLRRLKPGAPILLRDAVSGKFNLSLAWQQSPDLSSPFATVEIAPSQVSVTDEGNINLEITPNPGDTKAFYRIEFDE